MAVTVEKLAQYLAVAPDSVDDLSMYLDAARSTARNAGIPDFERNAQYDIFILSLAALYYDNRGMGGPVSDEAARRIIRHFVWSLRYAQEDTDG